MSIGGRRKILRLYQIEHQGFISSNSRYFITIALVACQQDVDQVGHVVDRDSAVAVDVSTGVAVGSACQQQVDQVGNVINAQAAITVHVTRHNVHVLLNDVQEMLDLVRTHSYLCKKVTKIYLSWQNILIFDKKDIILRRQTEI